MATQVEAFATNTGLTEISLKDSSPPQKPTGESAAGEVKSKPHPAEEYRKSLQEQLTQRAEQKLVKDFSSLSLSSNWITGAYVDKLSTQYPLEIELQEHDVVHLTFIDRVKTQWTSLKALFEELGLKCAYRGSFSIHLNSELLEAIPDHLFDYLVFSLSRKVSEIVYQQIDGLVPKVEERLKILIAQCPQLTSLDFTESESLPGKVFVEFVKLAPNLKKLNCEKCKELTDDTVKEILKTNPRMTGLSFIGCKRLSDAAFGAALAGCDSLERLYLADLAIGDGTVQAVKTLKALTHLSLRETQITDKAVKHLSEAAYRLQWLDVSSTALTGDGLEALFTRHFYVLIEAKKCRFDSDVLDGLLPKFPFVRTKDDKTTPILPTTALLIYYLKALFERVEFTFPKPKEMQIQLFTTNKVVTTPILTKEMRDYLSQYTLSLVCDTFNHQLARELAPLVTTVTATFASDVVLPLSLPRLSSLTLKGAHVKDGLFALLEASSLRSLTLDGCLELGTQGFQNISTCYHELHQLRVKRCPHLTYREIADLDLQLPSLDSFTFSTPKTEHEGALTSEQKISILKTLLATRKVYYQKNIETFSSQIEITAEKFGTIKGIALNYGLPSLDQRLKTWLGVVFSNTVSLTQNDAGFLLQVKMNQEFMLVDSLSKMIKGLASVKPVTLELCLDKEVNESHVKTLIGNLPSNIVHVILSNTQANPAPIQTLIELVSGYQNLQELSLSHVTLTEQHVQQLAKALPNLEGLHLTACRAIEALCKQVMILPSLRLLSLKDLAQITQAEVESLAKAYPLLTHVSLARCRKVPDTLFTILTSAFRNLESLDLTGCKLGSYTLKEATLERLKMLLLSDTAITDKGLEELARNVCNLTRLELNNTKVTLKGLNKLLERASGLQYLQLKGCTEVDNACVLAIASKCPIVHHVDLGDCPKIEESSIVGLYRGCPRLESVNLAGCSKIDPKLVALLQRYPRNMNEPLVLDLAQGLSNVALEIAMLHYYQISSLTLANAADLTPQRLNMLLDCLKDAQGNAGYLEEVVIEKCQGEDKGLFPILKRKAVNLRSLSWEGETTFGGLNELRDYKSLRKLCLKHIPKEGPGKIVSDSAFPAFAKQHKELRHLEISGFDDLRRNPLEMTLRYLPKLKTLVISNCQLLPEAEVVQLKQSAQAVSITLLPQAH